MLYDAHYGALTQIAALLVDDVQTTEHVVQAAFVGMHRAWRRLGSSDKALSYLRRSVVRQARSVRAACPAPVGQTTEPVLEAWPTADPQGVRILAALRGLQARQREAIVLRYLVGLPDAEIAAAMGAGVPVVSGHLRRGLAALGAALDCDPLQP